MSARTELRDLIADKLASQLLFGNTNGKAQILADAVMAALTNNNVAQGWLITGDIVRHVEETDLTDPGGEFWTYTAYCDRPGEDED